MGFRVQVVRLFRSDGFQSYGPGSKAGTPRPKARKPNRSRSTLASIAEPSKFQSIWQSFTWCHLNRAPKKHISKNKDRDIPYKPPYKEAQ